MFFFFKFFFLRSIYFLFTSYLLVDFVNYIIVIITFVSNSRKTVKKFLLNFTQGKCT